MPNSNPAIKSSQNKRHHKHIWFYVILLPLILPALAQTQQSIPQEFSNLTINQRALEKTTEITVDETTSPVTQNLALDKTGLILHLQTSPKIKDNTTKIRIFSSDGEEVKTFNFIDGTIFALVDPDKTYSIIQEIQPKCNELISTFAFDPLTTVCPDKESFKLFDNIMLISDTSYMFMLRTPSEFYTVKLQLPDGTIQQEGNFKNIEINNTDQITNSSVNIASLLKQGDICLLGSTKSKTKFTASKCSFENKNVQSLLLFHNDFNEKTLTNGNIDLIFSFLPNIFSNLTHEFLFNISETVKSEDIGPEITKTSSKKLFLENYTSTYNFNLGELKLAKTRIKKNIFKVTNPFLLDKTLNKTAIKIPFSDSEAVINPFTDKTIDSILTNLSIIGKEKKLPNSFNVSIDNNITLKNSQEPKEEEKPNTTTQTRQQTLQESEFLTVSSLIPTGTYDLKLNRQFSYIEQNIAPTVDEKGKPKNIINNKSTLHLTLEKTFEDLDLNNPEASLTLEAEKSANLLENKSFTSQLELSGFLIPPDFRPVVEEGYRATIELFMSIKLSADDSVSISYSDLKTKDEVPFTNFFKFSFLPKGVYQANIKFDADREKIFEMAGIVKTLK